MNQYDNPTSGTGPDDTDILLTPEQDDIDIQLTPEQEAELSNGRGEDDE